MRTPRAIAVAAAGRLGFAATVLSAADLPPDAVECEALLRRMERETVLSGAAWVIDCPNVECQRAYEWSEERC